MAEVTKPEHESLTEKSLPNGSPTASGSLACLIYVLLLVPQCSKSCGRGLRKRTVFCRSTDPGAHAVVVPDSMCRQHHRPKAQETCVLRRCPRNDRLQWIPTPWGEVRHKAQRPAKRIPLDVFVFSSHLLWHKKLMGSVGILCDRATESSTEENNTDFRCIYSPVENIFFTSYISSKPVSPLYVQFSLSRISLPVLYTFSVGEW